MIEITIGHLNDRPRSLLFVINPYGGRGLAEKIFNDQCHEIFKKAGVKTNLMLTENNTHAYQYMRLENLAQWDGVIACGGDGLFNEIVNGFIHRNDAWSKEVKDIRLGFIPAGSSNTIAMSVHGTDHVLTSCLNILLGQRMPLDLIEIHNVTNFDKNEKAVYCASMLAYGFFADGVVAAENYRWMGPARYDFTGFNQFLSLKSYLVEIKYRRKLSPPIHQECLKDCKICLKDPERPAPYRKRTLTEHKGLEQHATLKEGERNLEQHDEKKEKKAEWEIRTGVLVSLNVVSMACKHPKTSLGMSPTAHLSDGTFTIILIKECNSAQFLRFLLRLQSNSKNQFMLGDYVEIIENVEEAIFTCSERLAVPANNQKALSLSTWMADGEVITPTSKYGSTSFLGRKDSVNPLPLSRKSSLVTIDDKSASPSSYWENCVATSDVNSKNLSRKNSRLISNDNLAINNGDNSDSHIGRKSTESDFNSNSCCNSISNSNTNNNCRIDKNESTSSRKSSEDIVRRQSIVPRVGSNVGNAQFGIHDAISYSCFNSKPRTAFEAALQASHAKNGVSSNSHIHLHVFARPNMIHIFGGRPTASAKKTENYQYWF